MIEFEGELQEHEFRRAQRVSTPRSVRWSSWTIAAALVMVLLTGGIKPILADPLGNGIKLSAAVAIALFLIVARRRAVTRAWRNTPLLHERAKGQLAESGVTWKTASIDATFAWNKMIKHRITADLVLLHTSTRQALVLPRSYFKSDSDWESARTLITQKLEAA